MSKTSKGLKEEEGGTSVEKVKAKAGENFIRRLIGFKSNIFSGFCFGIFF